MISWNESTEAYIEFLDSRGKSYIVDVKVPPATLAAPNDHLLDAGDGSARIA